MSNPRDNAIKSLNRLVKCYFQWNDYRSRAVAVVIKETIEIFNIKLSELEQPDLARRIISNVQT